MLKRRVASFATAAVVILDALLWGSISHGHVTFDAKTAQGSC